MTMSQSEDWPKMPTAAECIAEIAKNYTLEGVAIVVKSRNRALGGETPEALMETVEGRRRVYAWARGLTEGVMG